MLKTVATMIAKMLGITEADVADTRTRLLKEKVSGGRRAASTALENSEGSTTPLKEAARRAQNTYARLRKQVEKRLPSVLALVIATTIAEQRRDETAKALAHHEDEERARLATGVHPEVRDHFARMSAHGVHPNKLLGHSNEEVAILADMTLWRAADPEYENPDNPWRDVLAIYASRLVKEAGYGVTVDRSVPGVPVPPQRHTDPKYYMFGAPTPAGGTAVPSSLAPTQAAQIPPIASATTIEDDDADVVPVLPQDNEASGTAAAPGSASDERIDEYALPTVLTSTEVDTLMRAAKAAVDADPGWQDALAIAIDGATDDSESAIIAAAAAATDIDGATPLRYFLEVAAKDGLSAGAYAFRDATIRRVAFEMAMAAKPKTAVVTDDRLTSLVSMLSAKGRDQPSA